jgi:hypothetical protein
MNRWTRGVALALSTTGAVAAVGCGGGPSMDSISSEMKTPTGTVDSTSVKAVGAKFEEQLAGQSQLPAFGGERDDVGQKTQAQSISCPAGGSLDASGSGSQTDGQTHASYKNCCFVENCCFDGALDVFYDSGNADFSACFDYDVSFNCALSVGETTAATSGALQFSACVSVSGTASGYVYLVEVEGLTYRVSGSISSGSGSIDITGVNGSFSCTYTNGSGSCSGTSGNFTF